MRHHVRLSIAVTILSLYSTLVNAQSGKVEEIGALTDSSVAESVRQSLETKGYKLTLDESKPTCELWLGKNVPAGNGKSEVAVYPQFSESTFLGVVHFPDAASDFRGHKIPAGYYTMRYELMPSDGNHLGAAPNPDFALLIPADSDPDPSARFKFQELVTLSAKTAGTRHPSPLSLVPADKPGPAAITKDDQDHWVFSGSLHLASGKELPFAIVVKGTAQQ